MKHISEDMRYFLNIIEENDIEYLNEGKYSNFIKGAALAATLNTANPAITHAQTAPQGGQMTNVYYGQNS